MTREAQKAEAVERLKALGFDSELVSKFETDGTVFICDPPSGKPIPADSDTVKEIGKLEAEYGCLVYLVIRDYSFSFLDSLIIVSQYDEEWELEKDDLKENGGRSSGKGQNPCQRLFLSENRKDLRGRSADERR